MQLSGLKTFKIVSNMINRWLIQF